MENLKIPTMLKLADAAELTGVSYCHLLNMCKRGQIVHVKAGKKYLVNMEKLVEYLNTGEAGA